MSRQPTAFRTASCKVLGRSRGELSGRSARSDVSRRSFADSLWLRTPTSANHRPAPLRPRQRVCFLRSFQRRPPWSDRSPVLIALAAGSGSVRLTANAAGAAVPPVAHRPCADRCSSNEPRASRRSDGGGTGSAILSAGRPSSANRADAFQGFQRRFGTSCDCWFDAPTTRARLLAPSGCAGSHLAIVPAPCCRCGFRRRLSADRRPPRHHDRRTD
jgi:hypothetical protein